MHWASIDHYSTAIACSPNLAGARLQRVPNINLKDWERDLKSRAIIDQKPNPFIAIAGSPNLCILLKINLEIKFKIHGINVQF